MPETMYNVEVKFKGSKRWEYVAQHYYKEQATRLAVVRWSNSRQTHPDAKFRVRKVVKTVVWKLKIK